MSANNVVLFPKTYKEGPLQSLEEIIDHVTENRKEHIRELVEDISEYVFFRAECEGFRITYDTNVKSTVMFVEALKAMLYESATLYHPLHKIAEDVITFESIEEGD